MKIALLHYACLPIVGGVESIMATHARLLERAGHEPFIIAGRGDPASAGLSGVIIPEIDSRHPEIVQVQKALQEDEAAALPEFNRWTDLIVDLLLDTLDGSDACIVHNAFTLHKNLPLTAALTRLAEGGLGTDTWVAWCHDLAWNNPLYQNELLPRWPWTPLKYQLPNVTYVAISEQRRDEIAALFRVPHSDIILIPNGIEASDFIPQSPQMAALRERLRWDERDWVLLAPVRITRRKNLELAIDVTASLRDMGAQPLLVVTGPPGPHNVRSNEYLDELLRRREEKDVAQEVVFLAVEGGEGGSGLEVSDALMSELYWWADALMMPSAQEGFGLPLLEAGLTRLPIFCSDIPAMREVGGLNAHYFQPGGDPDEIAHLMYSMLGGPGIAAHRRKVLSTYSWDAILPRIIETLEALKTGTLERSAIAGD
jgi:glycosyltransferase involved in cell wall biosynthesis